jgi:uncharacterized protein YkwD
MLIKKQIRMLFGAGLAVLALAGAVDAAAATKSAAGAEASLLRAVNQTRAAHGLRPLRVDTSLRRAAHATAHGLLRTNTFEHGDMVGRMLRAGVRARLVGENLAWGRGSYATPQSIVDRWLASPGHRRNLLRPSFTRIGLAAPVGSFQGSPGATVVAAEFAGP